LDCHICRSWPESPSGSSSDRPSDNDARPRRSKRDPLGPRGPLAGPGPGLAEGEHRLPAADRCCTSGHQPEAQHEIAAVSEAGMPSHFCPPRALKVGRQWDARRPFLSFRWGRWSSSCLPHRVRRRCDHCSHFMAAAARPSRPRDRSSIARLSGSVVPGMSRMPPAAVVIKPPTSRVGRTPMASTATPQAIAPSGLRASENSQSIDETRPSSSGGVCC
jgi:hypothetical protein